MYIDNIKFSTTNYFILKIFILLCYKKSLQFSKKTLKFSKN